jgi:hypothetical protein
LLILLLELFRRKSLAMLSMATGIFSFYRLCKQACKTQNEKSPAAIAVRLFLLSGWQDSNLRPSGPKPDALTGLRYTPQKSRKNRISFLIFILDYE